MGDGHKVFHPPTRKKKFVTDPTQPVSTNVSFFKNDHVKPLVLNFVIFHVVFVSIVGASLASRKTQDFILQDFSRKT